MKIQKINTYPIDQSKDEIQNKTNSYLSRFKVLLRSSKLATPPHLFLLVLAFVVRVMVFRADASV